MLEKINATNEQLIYAIKTKKCECGSLYDLIVAADNLQAFVNIMY